MSKEDPSLEKVWKRISIFDFNYRILNLRKNQAKESKSLEDEPFGLK
jgi:hypothetical protein